MASFHVVTDSTSVLSKDFAKLHGITVVPLKVLFGNEEFTDGVTIDDDLFFTKFEATDASPKTSQPSPGEFQQVFESFTDDLPILCLTISSKISGTFNSAEQGKAAAPSKTVTVIDTLSIGPPLNAMVSLASAMSEAGASVADTVSKVHTLIESQHFIFTVSTLEYLRRGGRIGGAQALLGNLLNIRPLLTLQEGKVEAVDRIRTFSKVLDRMVEDMDKKHEANPDIAILVAHANSLDVANELKKRCDTFSSVPIEIYSVGPVIAAHSGPGTVGVCSVPLLPEAKKLVSAQHSSSN